MYCPFCNHKDTKVIATREVSKFNEVRRRRECEGCQRRFTTYERIERSIPWIAKKGGQREQYSRDKVMGSLQKASGKRRIDIDKMEEICRVIESKLEQSDQQEVPSRKVAEIIMGELKKLDKIAFIRYVSEYRSFNDLEEFIEKIAELRENHEG